jgi:Flp pilus assembly protein TadG
MTKIAGEQPMAMQRKLRQRRQREVGIGFISLAITVPVFLVSAGLAVDVARMTHARNDLQNALDASALAAARAIYDSDTSAAKVQNSARDIAELNELQGTLKDGQQSKIKIEPSAIEIGNYDFPTATFTNAPQPLNMAQVNAVRIRASMSDAAKPIVMALVGVAGIESYNPTLSAIAVLGAPSKSKAVVPIVVVDTVFDGIPPGIPIAINLELSPGSDLAAWTGLIDPLTGEPVNPTGEVLPELIYNSVWNPSLTPEVKVGDIVKGTNGVMTPAYQMAHDELPLNSPFTVLVVKKTSSWDSVTVVGFASFRALPIIHTGGDKAISGELVKHDTEYTGETTSKCFGTECRPFLVD